MFFHSLCSLWGSQSLSTPFLSFSAIHHHVPTLLNCLFPREWELSEPYHFCRHFQGHALSNHQVQEKIKCKFCCFSLCLLNPSLGLCNAVMEGSAPCALNQTWTCREVTGLSPALTDHFFGGKSCISSPVLCCPLHLARPKTLADPYISVFLQPRWSSQNLPGESRSRI